MIWSLVLLAGVLGAWELYVVLAEVDEIILPAPSDVAVALADNPGLLWDNLQATGLEVVGGIALAVAAGGLLALALHLSGR
ncbi:MAG TPA: ABC transporter permease, partial [Solirubrobacteraceae bacterium]|nr:ABC transporter permease [Solirubrobacteraceae bacterium]